MANKNKAFVRFGQILCDFFCFCFCFWDKLCLRSILREILRALFGFLRLALLF